MALSEETKDLEFEGDTITVSPKTKESPSLESMSVKVGIAETRINDYLNESRFKVRSGLEQAFRDYRAMHHSWEDQEKPPIVTLISASSMVIFISALHRHAPSGERLDQP
jgi:hypothetical protein